MNSGSGTQEGVGLNGLLLAGRPLQEALPALALINQGHPLELTWCALGLGGPAALRQRALGFPDLHAAVTAWAADSGVEANWVELLWHLYIPLTDWLGPRIQASRNSGRAHLLGLSAPQGAGKSTLEKILQLLFERRCGLNTLGFSLDDLYLTRAEREDLATRVHPLLVTRGVPGTHDHRLGVRLLHHLCGRDGTQVRVPRFDKSVDDRAPQARWQGASADADVVIFEGWCVGATPQKEADLADPCNELERNEDPQGTWRHFVNAQLEGPYRRLFDPIDTLIYLSVPDFSVVAHHRLQQEEALAMRLQRTSSGTELAQSRLMKRTDIERFVQHYQRITEHMLRTLPSRADVHIALNEARLPISVGVMTTADTAPGGGAQGDGDSA